jgi:Uncharacterized conserved protein
MRVRGTAAIDRTVQLSSNLQDPPSNLKPYSVRGAGQIAELGAAAQQYLRFTMRIHDPLKQWKLSPMDVQSRSRWEQYTKAKEAMLERTHIPEAPWHVVGAVDKKKARLHCIAHLREQIPYGEIKHEPVTLPARVRNPEYSRGPVPPEMYVPQRY